MELWNDPEVVAALLDCDSPFYTAIGHSDQLLLADKFADAAFTTPSAFGHEVRNCLLDRLSYDHLVGRIVQQTRLWKFLCLLLTSFLVVLLLIRWFFPI
jgi:exodeoxyribonuclease VII large subunit